MRMKKEYKPSGSAGGVSIEPSWPYYKQLQVLLPFVKHRQTKRTFHTVADESQNEAVDSFHIIGFDTVDPTEMPSYLSGSLETSKQCSFDSAVSSSSLTISE